MNKPIKWPLLIGGALVLCAAAGALWLSVAEASRIAVALPSGVGAGPRVDAAAMAADLTRLHSFGLAVRPAGSFSGSATQNFLAARFGQIGMLAYPRQYDLSRTDLRKLPGEHRYM
ncbi:MAG TPA: hypothetical protein VGC21_03770, partial [Telluria sp.]